MAVRSNKKLYAEDAFLEFTHPFDSAFHVVGASALDNTQILSGDYWAELRTFLAVAKARSLTKASEELNRSQPTVGRDIRRLNDVMKCQLVIMSKSGASLTPQGRLLVGTLLRFDEELNSIARNLRDEAKSTKGFVRISITDGLGAVFLVPMLRALSEKHPHLQVQLKSPVNLRSLRENQTDLMVGFSPDSSQDLTCKQLGWLHFLPFAARSYIERKGVPMADNIHEHEFVDSEIYSSNNEVWKQWHQLVDRGRVSHFADSSITYGLMVKAGLGIGLLGNYNALEPGGAPLALGIKIAIPLYLIAVTERLMSKPVRIAAEYLENTFGPENPWFTKELHTEVIDDVVNEGYRMLFNL